MSAQLGRWLQGLARDSVERVQIGPLLACIMRGSKEIGKRYSHRMA